jgi:hypothetical protein
MQASVAVPRNHKFSSTAAFASALPGLPVLVDELDQRCSMSSPIANKLARCLIRRRHCPNRPLTANPSLSSDAAFAAAHLGRRRSRQ